MKIALIGSGNVSAIIGRLAVIKGHTIINVASRNIEHAEKLASEFKCGFTTIENSGKTAADIIIISVVDSAIEETIKKAAPFNGLVVHTAGAFSINVFNGVAENSGVLYPLQSLRKNMDQIPDIPFLIDGTNDYAINFIREFAETLSPWVKQTNDDERAELHAAAVIVSNFTNHLYTLAEDFCKNENLDFSLLKPLIIETATRIINHSPSELQTGPAVRKDISTLEKHLRIFSKYPKLRTTYMRLTDSIMN